MKKFKRAIGIITSAVMLMGSTTYAAGNTMSIVDAGTVMTYDTATVKINCGADLAGRNVVVVVFEPDSGFDALSASGTYAETNSQTVNAAISYSGQCEVQPDGTISFTYKPKGPKGKYFVRVGGEGIYESEMLSFDYVSAGEAQGIIDDLKLNSSVSNISDVFVKNSNPNVYTEYQMLSLDQTTMYPDFDAADPSVKNNIYTYISNRMGTVSTPADFSALFEKATYVEVLNGKSESDILAYIDTHKAYSGINLETEYTGIRENAEYFTDAIKAGALEKIAATDMSNMEIGATNTVIADALLLSTLSNCNTFGTLGNIILAFETEINAVGGNATGYKNDEAPYSVAQTLKGKQPFESLSAFAGELNAIVGPPGTPSTPTTPGTPSTDVDQPSFPSGNGGGVGGGTVISRPAANPGVLAGDAGNAIAPSITPSGFTDLAGFEWAESAIKTLKDKKIINGKTDTEFKPSEVVLREEFAKMMMLSVMPGSVETTGTESSFSDVDSSAWYGPYIEAATKNNIISGYGDTFGIGDTIRREDMAVMCYRALKAAGITLVAVRDEHKFTDAISDYAQEAISALYSAGLINGYSDTEFNANGTATRAEAATMLYNIIEKFGING